MKLWKRLTRDNDEKKIMSKKEAKKLAKMFGHLVIIGVDISVDEPTPAAMRSQAIKDFEKSSRHISKEQQIKEAYETWAALAGFNGTENMTVDPMTGNIGIGRTNKSPEIKFTTLTGNLGMPEPTGAERPVTFADITEIVDRIIEKGKKGAD
jgi:hypothetical protein